VELVKHTKYIYEYVDAVSSDVCDEIVSLIDSVNITDDMLFTKNKIRNNNALNITKYVDYHPNIHQAENIVNEIFSHCNIQYISDNPYAKYVVYTIKKISKLTTNYVYRSYDEGQYYEWHMDTDPVNHNLFSYILYLNDDFDGGNTLFLNDKLKVVPKKGSMLCAPCDYYTLHKSTKITRGNKKIIWSCVYP
jgi:hypothetical protein